MGLVSRAHPPGGREGWREGYNLQTGYSAIDFSLLDPHYGTMDDWKYLIDRMHERGIYIIMDFTVGTMGDMLGFVG